MCMRYSELAIVEQQLDEYRSLAKMASAVKSRLGPTAAMRARGRTEREIQRVVDAAHSNYRKWLSQLGLRPRHSFKAVRRSSTTDNWDDRISVLDNYLRQRRMPHEVYELDSEGNVDDSNLKAVSEEWANNWKEAIRQSVTAYMQSRAPRSTNPPLAASVRQNTMAISSAETPPPRTPYRTDQTDAQGQASIQSDGDQTDAPADDQSEPAQQSAAVWSNHTHSNQRARLKNPREPVSITIGGKKRRVTPRPGTIGYGRDSETGGKKNSLTWSADQSEPAQQPAQPAPDSAEDDEPLDTSSVERTRKRVYIPKAIVQNNLKARGGDTVGYYDAGKNAIKVKKVDNSTTQSSDSNDKKDADNASTGKKSTKQSRSPQSGQAAGGSMVGQSTGDDTVWTRPQIQRAIQPLPIDKKQQLLGWIKQRLEQSNTGNQ